MRYHPLNRALLEDLTFRSGGPMFSAVVGVLPELG